MKNPFARRRLPMEGIASTPPAPDIKAERVEAFIVAAGRLNEATRLTFAKAWLEGLARKEPLKARKLASALDRYVDEVEAGRVQVSPSAARNEGAR